MKFPKVPAPLVRPVLKLQKHSPKMMLGVGVVGVVTAGVMACKSTLKLSEMVEPLEKELQLRTEYAEGDQDYADGDFKKDAVKIQIRTVLAIAKLYAPAVAVAAVSISLITAAHVVQNRRAAAMTAAYAGLKEGYDKLRENVREKYGVEEEAKLRHGVTTVEETVEGKDGKLKTVKHEKAAGYSAYAQLFTEGNVNWTPNPDNNWFFLTSQRNYMNDKLQRDGVLFLNDVYEALGLQKTKAGQVVGWAVRNDSSDGDGFVDFGISDSIQHFFTDSEGSIWIDPNVDGEVLHLMS